MQKHFLSLGIATVFVFLSGCDARKEEKTASELPYAALAATADKNNNAPRIIHTKRFQRKPVTQRSEKPTRAGWIAITESSSIECVDIHTLSDGSTRHVDCGTFYHSSKLQDPESGLFVSTNLTSQRFHGYFSHSTGTGVGITRGIDIDAALRHRSMLRHKS